MGRDECQVTAYQRVGITAEVTIDPKVECGPVRVKCLPAKLVRVDGRRRGDRHRERPARCKVVLHQDLCVSVPVRFSVDAACVVRQMVCGPASTNPVVCLESGDCSGHTGSDLFGHGWCDGSGSDASDTCDASGSCGHHYDCD